MAGQLLAGLGGLATSSACGPVRADRGDQTESTRLAPTTRAGLVPHREITMWTGGIIGVVLAWRGLSGSGRVPT